MMGRVYLIGAGPGDLGLLTLKAVETLKLADTIVFDRLINPDILRFARKDASLIDVGKTPGGHLVPQEEINRILAKKASEGKTVARLKGGDPFVFGRGGEEALFLQARGIPFEIIPGVTSSISVPAYAGIPVTHRGIASSFHVITGHEAPGKEDAIDFEVISRLKGTLIFLMGIRNLSYIVENLVKYGIPVDTPCAIIMEGATGAQKTVTGCLSDIRIKAEDEDVKNPAIIVVGDVVSLRPRLQWYEEKELFGKRIMFTGVDFHEGATFQNSDDALGTLRKKGAEVLYCPTLKILPHIKNVHELLDEISEYDILIFTSKNGVEAFTTGMRKKKYDVRKLQKAKIWAIGQKTSEELQRSSIYPDRMPALFTAKALVEMVVEEDRGKRAAVITSDMGGEELILCLKKSGIFARKITAYKNKVNFEGKDRLIREIGKGVDIIIFTSPSTFYNMEKILGDDMDKVKETMIAAIGPTTRDAIEAEGYRVDIIPDDHTFEGIAQEIVKYYDFR